MSFFKRAPKASTPATSPGSPTYDATIHPTIPENQVVEGLRLQVQTDLHLFDDKTAAAEAFSHYRQASPSPTAVAMMGLGQQQALIEKAMTRKDEYPFPGAHLGPMPSVQAAPPTNYIVGGASHLTHHAHRIESKRATRLRFGR